MRWGNCAAVENVDEIRQTVRSLGHKTNVICAEGIRAGNDSLGVHVTVSGRNSRSRLPTAATPSLALWAYFMVGPHIILFHIFVLKSAFILSKVL